MRWTFGVEPLPPVPRLRVAAAHGDRPRAVARGPARRARAPHRRAAQRRGGARASRARQSGAARRRERGRRTDASTSITRATSAPSTRASRPTRSVSTAIARRARSRFPIAYEGPPGIVHGGFLAVFFDSIIQHHNCDVGVAGKTTSLDGDVSAADAAPHRAAVRGRPRARGPQDHLHRAADGGRRRALRGADERGRRGPAPACPRSRRAGPRRDGHDDRRRRRAPAHHPRAAARAGRVAAARPCCWPATTTSSPTTAAERRSAALARGSARRGRRQGDARRDPPPQRQRVRRRLARRRPDRCRQRPAQHVLDQRGAPRPSSQRRRRRCCSSASSYRSHDYVAALRDAVPELDLGIAPPLFADSLPVLRRIAFVDPGEQRRSGLVDAMDRGARAVDRARRPRGGGSGRQRRRPAHDRAHLGLDRRRRRA